MVPFNHVTGFPPPQWFWSDVLQPLFDASRAFSEGPAVQVASSIVSLILLSQAVLGSAELVMNKECRFYSASFWVRLAFVSGLLLFGRNIFFNPIQDATMQGMNKFAKTWVDSLEYTADAFMVGLQNREKLFSMNPTSAFSAEFVYKMITGMFLTGIGLIVSVIALILMLLVALIGCGTISLVCAVWPIYIAFGLSSVTESMAFGYFRLWFGNAIMYLPLLMLSMQISTDVSLSAIQQAMAPAATTQQGFSQFFGMIFGPLIGLALIFVGPRVVKSLTSAV